ncbi:MAG: hypothetical protein KA354_18235 [Phycisphaerae bacterium]|nr:hypothetical protein [Phycisphaerae bacterium]
MRAFPLVSLACAFAGVIPSDVRAEESFKVTVTQITEIRSKILTTKAKDAAQEGGVYEVTGAFNGVILRLRAEGKGIQAGMRAENIKIIEAVDDTGQRIRSSPEATGMADASTWRGDASLPDWASPGVSGIQAKEPRKSIDVQIRLTSPSRKATKLARVKGEFDIRIGGSGKSASFRNLPASLGKTLNDPVLKDASVAITLVEPKEEDGQDAGAANNVLTLRVRGNLKQQSGKVELLDNRGNDVVRSKTSMSMGGTTTLTYDLKKPLDNTMVLKVSFLVGQKPTTVPFDLRDIELP